MASGLAAGDLRQFGRIIELAERHVDLVGDLALEEALEAGERIAPGLVIGRDQEDLLQAGVLRVFAGHAERLVVLIGRDEEIRIAFLAGEIGGAGVRADQDRSGIGHRFEDSPENIGEDRADDEVDLIALEQRLGLGDGDVGLEFVVLHDHLDLAAAELAAEVLDRELEAVAQLLAEHRRRSGERGDDADLELFLCAHGGGHKRQGRSGCEQREYSIHLPLPRKRTLGAFRLAPGLQGRQSLPSIRRENANSKSNISLVKPRHAGSGAFYPIVARNRRGNGRTLCFWRMFCGVAVERAASIAAAAAEFTISAASCMLPQIRSCWT